MRVSSNFSPSSNTAGRVDILRKLIENNNRGLVSIRVPSNFIREHNIEFF